ncbi:MAG TPA: ATP-dependent DNA helicase RecG [Afifellaceae bacterium]|nr:ATP-dependent DNA helicase RecG [Afifellaceae bacterium]
MRPSILDPLFASLESLPKIGPKLARAFARLLDAEQPQIRDLLFHLPVGITDRRGRVALAHLPLEGIVTVEAEIVRHDIPPRNSRAPWRVTVSDGSDTVKLIYFNPRADWLNDLMPVGSHRIISGRVEWYKDIPQIIHPDYVLPPESADEMPLVEPRYPLTAGLTAKQVLRTVHAALERLPNLAEWLTEDRLSSEGWPAFSTALGNIHLPGTPEDCAVDGPAWRRLAYDESLASQLALGLVRASMKRARGRAWPEPDGGPGGPSLSERIRSALPFSLTGTQEKAVDEISADLHSADRMVRLLHGDVGSGKTLVALLAMARIVEAGGQGVMMAPTELLAIQHFETIRPLAEKAGIHTDLLTGRMKAAERKAALARVASGAAQIVVGTHALFQASVEFADLGLVVVDEQHRFGVHQRLALSAKGTAPDLLVMTATPIPRTLVLTFYGDMDVSQLTEKPAGRQPINTRTVPLDRLGDVVSRIGEAIGRGEKAYWICPLVSESELIDITSAEARYESLKAGLGDKVGIVHGRMKANEKDAVMTKFRTGEIAILVATTVVEVGVDVPDATIMVIEHAERFGLAQLHQLRGRVGRGDRPSSCLLLYRTPIGETAKARLTVMRETEDGFRIAEEDLRLRGEGDVLGLRQSGMPGFRLLVPDSHADLLQKARDDARYILATDREFTSQRADNLRNLLYLFGRDDAVRLMRSG